MNRHAGKRNGLLRRAWQLVLVSIVVLTVASLPQLSSTVHGQEPDSGSGSQTGEDSPPVDNCFGGALSEDPLHCYVLQQAHLNGIIEVDAVYGVGIDHWAYGGLISFYLKQSEPVEEHVYRYIESKAQEEVRRSGGDECVLASSGCLEGIFRIRGSERRYILPLTRAWRDIWLLPGGADARRSEPGWASFQQLWPAAAGGSDGATGAAGDGSFDVSDVDTINLPSFPPQSCPTNSCYWSKEYPGLDIAGWHTSGYSTWSKVWVQVAINPGEGSEKIAAVREEFKRRLGYDENNVMIIPVKYNYKDMWHWNEILNRFALSSGNTLGIRRAEVNDNFTPEPSGPTS